MLLLAGCNAVPDIAALATGTTAGALSSSPYVGIAVGLGTRAAVGSSLKYVRRNRQGERQAAVATAASGLAVGESAPWATDFTIPIGSQQGTVEVVRRIETPLATCKEIVFTAAPAGDPPASERFASTICEHDGVWRWALAEPAVGRWGMLQ